jgi:hypothetical protein
MEPRPVFAAIIGPTVGSLQLSFLLTSRLPTRFILNLRVRESVRVANH